MRIVLPASLVVVRWDLSRRRSMLTLALIGAAVGTVLMPAYLFFLEPRGTIDIPRASGLIAGAAVSALYAQLAAGRLNALE